MYIRIHTYLYIYIYIYIYTYIYLCIHAHIGFLVWSASRLPLHLPLSSLFHGGSPFLFPVTPWLQSRGSVSFRDFRILRHAEFSPSSKFPRDDKIVYLHYSASWLRKCLPRTEGQGTEAHVDREAHHVATLRVPVLPKWPSRPLPQTESMIKGGRSWSRFTQQSLGPESFAKMWMGISEAMKSSWILAGTCNCSSEHVFVCQTEQTLMMNNPSSE